MAQPPPVFPEQRQALVELYLACNGTSWSQLNQFGWSGYMDPTNWPCEWTGVRCQTDYSENESFIVQLGLFEPNMAGVLPDLLSSLTGLTFLTLSGGAISGTLPASFSALTRLQTLSLSHNAFSGPIPDQWSTLAGLNSLDLSQNQLSGTIPGALSTMVWMTSLALNSNRLTGPLPEFPDSIGVMADLVTLDLSHNDLKGPIGDAFGSLASLRSLRLTRNNLNGTLPNALSVLGSLTKMDLSSNSFSGPLDIVTNLVKLVELDLQHNQFSGTITPSLSVLTALTMLNVGYNALSGTLPTELGALGDNPETWTFNVTHNKLIGDPMSGVVLQWSQKVYYHLLVDMSYNFLEGQPYDVGTYDANCFWGNTYTREPSGCSSCTTPSCCASALNTCNAGSTEQYQLCDCLATALGCLVDVKAPQGALTTVVNQCNAEKCWDGMGPSMCVVPVVA